MVACCVYFVSGVGISDNWWPDTSTVVHCDMFFTVVIGATSTRGEFTLYIESACLGLKQVSVERCVVRNMKRALTFTCSCLLTGCFQHGLDSLCFRWRSLPAMGLCMAYSGYQRAFCVPAQVCSFFGNVTRMARRYANITY